MDYKIVDGDTHINEPPGVWLERVPERFKDVAPRIVKAGHGGAAWSFDGGREIKSISPTINVLGVSPVKWTLLCENFEDLSPGAWVPEERVKDMAVDMIDIHVLYPTYVMGGAQCYSRRDREVQIACVRAYNDWMSEFSSADPEKLWGLATLPVTGVEDAMEEARRVKDLPGIRGIQLTAFPNGHDQPRHDVDDPFWSLAEEMDMPLTIHVGFSDGGEIEDMDPDAVADDAFGKLTLPLLNVGRQAVPSIGLLSHFVLGGVFQRHPKLRLGFAEVGIAWIPFFMEQTDFNYVRHRFWSNGHLERLPSEYVRDHIYSTFQEDNYGLRNRDLILDNIMWSSDYPHSGSDWPFSRQSINNQTRGWPAEEKERVLSSNGHRLFGVH